MTSTVEVAKPSCILAYPDPDNPGFVITQGVDPVVTDRQWRSFCAFNPETGQTFPPVDVYGADDGNSGGYSTAKIGYKSLPTNWTEEVNGLKITTS